MCCAISFNLNGVGSVVWSSFFLFFFTGTVQKEPSHFFHLFPFPDFEKEKSPDYFGSYNNSALIKKGKKMVHFNSFSAVEFHDLGTLKGCPWGIPLKEPG